MTAKKKEPARIFVVSFERTHTVTGEFLVEAGSPEHARTIAEEMELEEAIQGSVDDSESTMQLERASELFADQKERFQRYAMEKPMTENGQSKKTVRELVFPELPPPKPDDPNQMELFPGLRKRLPIDDELEAGS